MKISIKYAFWSILVLSLNVKAQQRGVLNYSMNYDDKARHLTKDLRSNVYFEGDRSIEFLVPKNLNVDGENKIEQVSASSSNFYVKASKPSFILKDFGKKTLLLADYARFNDVRLVEDTLNNFNWVISKEKQKIGVYNCIKASVNFRGRTYDAWFTTDVNIKNGPWKFGGLPGLIVKVSDTNQMFTYQLMSINLETEFDSAIISLPKAFHQMEPISHKEITMAYQKMLKEAEEKSKIVSYDAFGSATITISFAPRKEIY